jgi:hypothetical protein
MMEDTDDLKNPAYIKQLNLVPEKETICSNSVLVHVEKLLHDIGSVAFLG